MITRKATGSSSLANDSLDDLIAREAPSMKPAINVLVYGGGAVGSIFGWRVASAGHSVSVVCRSNYEAVRQGGYSLRTNAWGSGRFLPHKVLRSGHLPLSSGLPAYDYVVCANKITDDGAATLRDLRALVHPKTTLVAAQNGMNVELPLRRQFPRNSILSAVCNIGCSQLGPGYVEQTASIKRPAFLIGSYHRTTDLDDLKRDALVAMDHEFETIECVQQERWRKLVFNSAWNSTTALTGLDTHQLLARPGAAELVQQIAKETHSVASASGVTLDEELPEKTVELARSSAPITPSTLQDARNKRPMELAPIFGFIVSQAAKVGASVPYLQQVHNLLQQRNSAFIAQSALHEPLGGPQTSVIDLLSKGGESHIAARAT